MGKGKAAVLGLSVTDAQILLAFSAGDDEPYALIGWRTTTFDIAVQ